MFLFAPPLIMELTKKNVPSTSQVEEEVGFYQCVGASHSITVCKSNTEDNVLSRCLWCGYGCDLCFPFHRTRILNQFSIIQITFAVVLKDANRQRVYTLQNPIALFLAIKLGLIFSYYIPFQFIVRPSVCRKASSCSVKCRSRSPDINSLEFSLPLHWRFSALDTDRFVTF